MSIGGEVQDMWVLSKGTILDMGVWEVSPIVVTFKLQSQGWREVNQVKIGVRSGWTSIVDRGAECGKFPN